MAAMLMAMITLLGVPQGGGTESEINWETVAVQILEDPPETAARTLLDWAASGASAPPQGVEDLLEARTETAAETAAAFAAVLDAVDSLRAAGEGPGLGEETYRETVRSLSAFFTRLLETETTPWKEEPSDWPGELAVFDGIWCDSTAQELLIFRNGTCRVVIPWLGAGFYGEMAYAARLRDRSGVWGTARLWRWTSRRAAIFPARWPTMSPAWRKTTSGATPRPSGLISSGRWNE